MLDTNEFEDSGDDRARADQRRRRSALAHSFVDGQKGMKADGIYEEELRKVKNCDVAPVALQTLQLLSKERDAGEIELSGQPYVRGPVLFLAADRER